MIYYFLGYLYLVFKNIIYGINIKLKNFKLNCGDKILKVDHLATIVFLNINCRSANYTDEWKKNLP